MNLQRFAHMLTRRMEIPSKINRDEVSIIQRGSLIEGNLNFKGYLIIAGEIQGNLKAETVVTQSGSRISGELNIRSLNISGNVEGDIIAESLILQKTAEVNGNIQCSNLIIEEGAVLNGAIKWLKEVSDTNTANVL